MANYTDIGTDIGIGIGDPQGITSRLDAALWFTNDGNSSIGR